MQIELAQTKEQMIKKSAEADSLKVALSEKITEVAILKKGLATVKNSVGRIIHHNKVFISSK